MARDLRVNRTAVDSDKYVYREERDLSKTQVDWGTVSKELTTTINTIRDSRETKKAEIETAQVESMNKLAEFDQYNNKSLNESVLEGSDWAKNALSTQYDLLTRGLITSSEYKRYEQRTKDSFSSLKGNLDNFATHYDEAAVRLEKNESNIGEWAINDTLSGLANLGQYKLSGNPATGSLAYIKTGNDPKTGKPYDPSNPANQISLAVINSRINQKMDFVPTVDSATKQVDSLGEVVSASVLELQGVKTMEDWRKMPRSKKMMADMVTAISHSDSQKLSILQERLMYTKDNFTEDPAEAAADSSLILMTPDPNKSGSFVFEFNPEQEEKIRNAAELALEAQISIKAGFTKGFAEQKESNLEAAKNINLDEGRGYFKSLKDFITAEGTTANSGAQNLVNEFNKDLKEGESPYQQVKRNVNSTGNIVSFELTREDGEPMMVDVEGLNTVDAMRELWGAATPGGAMKWETLMREDPTLLVNFPTAFGIGEASGQGQLDEYGVIDISSTSDSLGGQTPLSYIQSELGGTLASWMDNPTQVKEVYENVINAALPSQMFDDIGGSEGVEITVTGSDITIRVGESETEIKNAWDGSQDATIGQMQVIEDLIGEERQRLQDKRAGRGASNAQPMSHADWVAANPGGTYAEYQDYYDNF
tara:strand:- start:1845 stop:3794 length:1950 start_codon:yes stop_codon:yes gene_type:complete